MKGSYLVVGGTSGIGQEIVKQLESRHHRVWVTSRNATIAHQQDRIAYNADDSGLVTDRLPETLQGLVYCPGTINLKSFRRLTDDDFREDWDVNFLGAVRVIRSCLDKLKRSENGASIVLFSTVAVKTGMPLHASIAAAKGAVEGLTRALAAEFSPEVRVNAIAPSLTSSPLAASLLKSERQADAARQRHPLKAIGRPEDMAAMAVHLLSDSARWMTGQIVTIDGGLSAVRVLS